jgi:hypothetical protein
LESQKTLRTAEHNRLCVKLVLVVVLEVLAVENSLLY